MRTIIISLLLCCFVYAEDDVISQSFCQFLGTVEETHRDGTITMRKMSDKEINDNAVYMKWVEHGGNAQTRYVIEKNSMGWCVLVDKGKTRKKVEVEE